MKRFHWPEVTALPLLFVQFTNGERFNRKEESIEQQWPSSSNNKTRKRIERRPFSSSFSAD
jgi:hypothetical protein